MSERQKMLKGELYRAEDPELTAERLRAERLLARFEAAEPGNPAARMAVLRELLGALGEGALVMPGFRCDYGGNIRIGRRAFINYNCVLLDCAEIDIGDDLQMGPAVQLYTAQHPLDAAVRRSGLEFARPIRIGDNVWIGGGAIVLAGVTLGDHCVIGAGSVVTRDVPPGTVVGGNPARRLRDAR